eukprot:SAG22_NODE_145_length_17656_cov_33.457367_9_plen_66_part_00
MDGAEAKLAAATAGAAGGSGSYHTVKKSNREKKLELKASKAPLKQRRAAKRARLAQQALANGARR